MRPSFPVPKSPSKFVTSIILTNITTLQIPSGLYAIKDETHIIVPSAAAYNFPLLTTEEARRLAYFRHPEASNILELGVIDYISPYVINYYTRILDLAAKAPDIKGVMMTVKTAGGMVDQLVSFADYLHQYPKPIVTHTSYCCSAGYWIASQTSEIWAEPQSATEIGSIGTIYVHVDNSEKYAKEGTKYITFRSEGSTRKGKPNSYEPLEEKDAKRFQAKVDAANLEFKAYVRRGRGRRLKSDIVWEGDTYDADQSVTLGLADRKGNYNQALQRLIQLSDK